MSDIGKPKAKKRVQISQSDFPRMTLEEAMKVPAAIWDNFAGKGAAPHHIAEALEISPTSSNWRILTGTSCAYGLTHGGYNAKRIELTPLGRRIVAPTKDGDDAIARGEAVLQPRIMSRFLHKYDRANFPKDNIARNILIELGIPQERSADAVDIIRKNGESTGIIKKTKTGYYVAIDSSQGMENKEGNDFTSGDPPITTDHDFEEIAKEVAAAEEPATEPTSPQDNNVFISHGKNTKIVSQLKKLLTYGKFNPVVSVEKSTTSIPVPEKVLDDMAKCSAAIIHIDKEGEFTDEEGNTHTRLNENVLIEIGAALALYKKKFVLLVENGVTLPSNLQGLYRCDYGCGQLDYDATMKLLEIFNDFR